MMIYYCKKNDDGAIVGIGQVEEERQISAGYEACTKEVRDAWMAERLAAEEARQEALATKPSPEERLRADVDYIAAMTGVSL